MADRAAPADHTAPAPTGERIAKHLARVGLCSRREAERWIEQARVAVGGKVLTSAAFNVRENDYITVDGKPIPAVEPARLWRYHKPAGLITTNHDPQGRPTVFARLPPELPRVMTVGRLDLTSEGLLLLTNDGGLAREMELPSRGWIRRYRVRVHGIVDRPKLEALGKGPTVEGVEYAPIQATIDEQRGTNAWLTVSLREGKNREIRRVMEWLGCRVARLIRTAYGPFQLGQLPRGAVDEVGRKAIRDQLGRAVKPAPRRQRA